MICEHNFDFFYWCFVLSTISVVVVIDEVDVVVVLILFFDVISLKSLAFNESPIEMSINYDDIFHFNGQNKFCECGMRACFINMECGWPCRKKNKKSNRLSREWYSLIFLPSWIWTPWVWVTHHTQHDLFSNRCVKIYICNWPSN